MSRTLVQPVGQKRLTNVAVVRLKKLGNRFEIACYKNKVLSWRSGVEKDLDEVLQSSIVYSNVSKGVLAKSRDLVAAFGHDDQNKICLEILEKGELQVAGKERESQLASQFRDIATLVMQRTVNPETQRPYTITMIERLMHEVHFAVDPNSNSKKQSLDVIRELSKHYPIKRAPMRLRLNVPETNISTVVAKLADWKAAINSREVTGTQASLICEMEPWLYRECDEFVRNLQGVVEILSVNVHIDSDTHVDHEDEPQVLPEILAEPVLQLSDDLQKQTISAASAGSSSSSTTTTAADEGQVKQTISTASGGSSSSSTDGVRVKQNKCSTCNSVVGDSKEYREHFKSEWHKHNLKRKTRQLPPLTAEECMSDLQLSDSKADLKEYSF